MTVTVHQIGGPSPFPIIEDFRTDPRAFLSAGAPTISEDDMNQRTIKTMQKQCDDFNARYQVGQPIAFWTGPREGNPTHEGAIRFPAEIMGGHTPMVWVEGKGSIALSHVAGPASQPNKEG